MRKDEFTFGFNLLVTTPAVYYFKVDGQIIKDFDVNHRGTHYLEAPVSLEHGQEHSISLAVEAIPGRNMAVVNNLYLLWNQDVNETRTARMSRDRGPNEVWDYNNSNATAAAMNLAASRKNRIVNLDYMLDQNNFGYISRYCRFVGDDGKVDDLGFRRGKLYNIHRSGEFVFTFRSPIAYWMLERFYRDPIES